MLTHRMYNKGSRRQEGWKGKENTVWNGGMRSVEGRGTRQGTQSKQDGHDRDFQVITRQGPSGRKAGNLKEVCLGWINGGRKDRGFGWGKISEGGKQLL